MNNTFLTLVDYFIRVIPGLLLGLSLIFLLRREPRMRVLVYIGLFILLRDALTPLGLWSFGREGGFWIRLSDDKWFLLIFGIISVCVVGLLYFFDKPNSKKVIWLKGKPLAGYLTGIAGMLIVISPFLILYQFTPISNRGGMVNLTLVPFIAAFALLGNLFEELLFRGYVINIFSERKSTDIPGIWSGIVFAFCHIYLATTVTDVGYPLILFCIWEGIIAGLVGEKYGVLPATITHGGTIFILASGLF